MYSIGMGAFFLFLLGCTPNQDQEKEQLKEGLEIGHESLYGDEKGFTHYAFFVKNTNQTTIKSATLGLFLAGSKSGMNSNEVSFENLFPGDSVKLSVNLYSEYPDQQGYSCTFKVKDITY
ncbi:hypothetical protein GCM10007390_18530 [Persicitalea jodogahamensis]|uniref:Uncharacterized protein n=2 Tax=Persicitalea jodogahamensis TaxID=402147 RepID=A0A8J3D8C3_9BACT|nr:hypothetical protein GCM10007390_18530 [Persicitalea jodogahamensis]